MYVYSVSTLNYSTKSHHKCIRFMDELAVAKMEGVECGTIYGACPRIRARRELEEKQSTTACPNGRILVNASLRVRVVCMH
jgi:hypothetical protein